MTTNPFTSTADSATPAWQPLSARQRRVLGTLMEKSKTTPESYPLTILALTTGCNQKSNRNPVNNYSQEQIEETVDYLKGISALALVHGNGRVPKVRHLAYQWMGLSKVEAAIMTELLLRGEQTLGELRTRASRMEPINDLAHLQQLLGDLEQRNLVQFLTPAGRGQVVTHTLYLEQEKAALEKQFAGHTGTSTSSQSDDDSEEPRSTPTTRSNVNQEIQSLRETVEQLVQRIKFLEDQLDARWTPDA